MVASVSAEFPIMKIAPRYQKLLDGIRADFVFDLRPSPLPGDMRPEWRIAVLVMALNKCGRGGKMTLKKAHVVNWAVRDEATRETFLRMISGNRQLEDIVVRFDPAFNRALDLAAGEDLVSMEKKTTGLIIELLEAGRRLAATLDEHIDCLKVEREFFEAVRKISENKIEELLEWEAKI
jgi:hypothetical protein